MRRLYLAALLNRLKWIAQYVSVYSGSLSSFILVPYLTRVLGLEGYGKFAVAQAFALLFALVLDFGFLYSGTKLVVESEGSYEKRRAIWITFLAKLVVVALLTPLLIAPISFGMNFLSLPLLLTSIAYAVAQSFLPTWIFWGLNKYFEFALVEGAGRLLSLPAVFLLVNRPEHAQLALFLIFMTTAIVAALSWVYISTRYPPCSISFEEVLLFLRGATAMWIYRILGNAYLNLMPILLGFFSVKSEVGAFAAVDKLVKAGFLSAEPVFRAAFPRLTRFASLLRSQDMRNLDKNAGGPFLRLFWWSALPVIGVSISSTFLFMLFGDRMIGYIFGEKFVVEYPGASLLLGVYSLVIPIHALTKLLLVGIALPMGCSYASSGSQFLGLAFIAIAGYITGALHVLNAVMGALLVLLAQFIVLLSAAVTLLTCLPVGGRRELGWGEKK